MNKQEEVKCSTHPCAPHGFDRNASHNEHRYVCECEGWSPDDCRKTPCACALPRSDELKALGAMAVEAGGCAPPVIVSTASFKDSFLAELSAIRQRPVVDDAMVERVMDRLPAPFDNPKEGWQAGFTDAIRRVREELPAALLAAYKHDNGLY